MQDVTASPEARAALALVDRIYPRLNARRSDIEMAEKYYDGNHNLTFATKEWMRANGARYSEFSDNWCGVVANAEAERLQVLGIQYRGDDIRSASSVGLTTWDDWSRNEMDAQSSQGILMSLVAKRSYVSVWGDDQGDEVTPLYSWEHPANVEIEYDFRNPRLRRAAIKTWVDEDHEYAILYQAHTVWKWRRRHARSSLYIAPWAEQARTGQASKSGWEPWQESDDDTWPIGNPIGAVPVVEIPNRPLLRGEPVSELGVVIPKQNAINLLWAYLFLAADFASMPARVLLNTDPPQRQLLDKDGRIIGKVPVTMQELNEKRFAVFNGKDAKIDQWDPARLDVFTDAVSIMVGHIAAQTRTPPTYLVTKSGMSNVSAEGLKASEIGLVKKAIEFQLFASPAIKEVIRLGHLVRGNAELADQTRLATLRWANPEIRSEAQLADSLVKKRGIGYPVEYLMELDGISPGDMARILGMIDRESSMAFALGAQDAVQGQIDGQPA